MALYLSGLGLFLATHLFSAFRSRRFGKDLRKQMGEGVFMAAYGIIALGAFVMMVYGYNRTDAVTSLYVAPVWSRHLNYLLMPIALIILASAYMPTGYIKKSLKHPMLVAVKLWALGHLLANGELRVVILCVAFLAYAVIARIAAKRRGDEGPGPDAAASITGDALSVVVGLIASAALILYLHPILFGRAIWPVA